MARVAGLSVGELAELALLAGNQQPAYAGHQNRARAGVQHRLIFDRKFARFVHTAETQAALSAAVTAGDAEEINDAVTALVVVGVKITTLGHAAWARRSATKLKLEGRALEYLRRRPATCAELGEAIWVAARTTSPRAAVWTRNAGKLLAELERAGEVEAFHEGGRRLWRVIWVDFGEVAHKLCGMQSQYCSQYVDGRHACLNFGEGLRWRRRHPRADGDCAVDAKDYHNIQVHRDDAPLFAKRVNDYRREMGQIQ